MLVQNKALIRPHYKKARSKNTREGLSLKVDGMTLTFGLI